MSDPTPETAQALAIGGSLIQFATESKSGLATDVIAKIETALEAQKTNQWAPQIAAEFWTAYDKLCSHLKPVTVDTFRGAQIKAYRPLGQQGPTYQLSSPQLCAWMFSATLFALLIATAFSLFVASAGDTLVTEIDALKTQGDSIVKDIRV